MGIGVAIFARESGIGVRDIGRALRSFDAAYKDCWLPLLVLLKWFWSSDLAALHPCAGPHMRGRAEEVFESIFVLQASAK